MTIKFPLGFVRGRAIFTFACSVAQQIYAIATLSFAERRPALCFVALHLVPEHVSTLSFHSLPFLDSDGRSYRLLSVALLGDTVNSNGTQSHSTSCCLLLNCSRKGICKILYSQWLGSSRRSGA